MKAARKPVRVHFITFATSNWTESLSRMKRDLTAIQNQHHFFSSYDILTEKNLGNDWREPLQKYCTDRAYAFWTWKPYIIWKKLKKLKPGEVLLYIDGGCSLPLGEQLEDFLNDLKAKCDGLSDETWLGCARACSFANKTIVRREVLKFFNLSHDDEFLTNEPMYAAGLLLIRKSQESVNFIETWWKVMRDNYLALLHYDYYDKTGQCDGFVHHGGDQAVFNCLIRVNNVTVSRCDDLFIKKYKLITRIRK